LLVSGIAQVLLNDQSSRACAEGRVVECEGGLWKGKAGWKRKTKTTGIEYLEHEFGIVEYGHEFSYWPGFSLNPGVWDLERIKDAWGGDFVFDVDDKRFEQSFSMNCYDKGLLFGHLGQVAVKHIGDVVSSYILNGEARPFDLIPG